MRRSWISAPTAGWRWAARLAGAALALSSLPLAGQPAAPTAPPAPPGPVPLDPAPRPDAAGQAEVAFLLRSAKSALASGFASTAASIFRQASVYEGLDPATRGEVLLGLASALIAEGLYSEAGQVLDRVPDQAAPATALRRAVVAFQEGDYAVLEAGLGSIDPDGLGAADRAWFHLLSGLSAEAAGETGARDRAFRRAREGAVSEVQRAQFDAAILRGQLIAGGTPKEADLQSLKEKFEATAGRRAGFRYAKVYAIMLHRLGRRDEAAAVIESQIKLAAAREDDLKADFYLLLALVNGLGTAKGRLALEEILREDKGRELQQVALHLLATAGAGADPAAAEAFNGVLTELLTRHLVLETTFTVTKKDKETGKDKTETFKADVTAVGDVLVTLKTDRGLMETFEKELFSEPGRAYLANWKGPPETRPGRPAPHSMLDHLLFHRAQQYLRAGEHDRASMAGVELVGQYPASPLRRPAFQLLAYIAWSRDQPQYRIVAGHLNQLRAELPEGEERAALAALVADCFYLKGDYEQAADAYGAAIREVTAAGGGGDVGRLLFQRVKAEIDRGALTAAQGHLDAAGAAGIDALSRWRAEWNLVSELKRSGQGARAAGRIAALLAEPGASVPAGLRLRLMWLDAELDLQGGRYLKVPGRVDAILAALEGVPEAEIPGAQREQIAGRTLLLSAEALLAGGGGAGGGAERGLEVMAELRDRFPGSDSAVRSYLVEARHFAARDELVLAMRAYRALADRFPGSKYVPVALYEYAICLARRGAEATSENPADILKLITKENSEIYFYALLLRADELRKQNDFATAEAIYKQELLGDNFDEHPQYLAEMALAACVFAQAGQNSARIDEAIGIYERLARDTSLPSGLRAEAGFMWGYAASRQKNLQRAKVAYTEMVVQFLREPPEGQNPGETGRYWLARTLFEMAALLEREGEIEEALLHYEEVVRYGLPGSATASAKIAEFTRPAK